MHRVCLTLLLGVLLAACSEQVAEAPPPAPRDLDREAIGHYCRMIVADHPGPKAQLFLDDREAPYWFSSVRDALAFTLLPEEPRNIAAIYVNDMSSTRWEAPGNDSWIALDDAWFVVGSERAGGMGAPEAVPFGSAAAAAAFADRYGGRVVRRDGISADYVLGEVATPPPAPGHAATGHGDGLPHAADAAPDAPAPPAGGMPGMPAQHDSPGSSGH
jgi:copper chaperone NosL